MPFIELIETCDRCGSNRWMHISGAPDELSGYECYDCGKGFIPDKKQKPVTFSSLPVDIQEHLEYLMEI